MQKTYCRLLLTFVWMLCAELNLAFAESLSPQSVDLHAHFFMQEGAGHDWLGRFNQAIKPSSWDTRIAHRVDQESLDRSGVAVAVVALYAHPLFAGSLRNSIRRQILTANEFIKTHPNWIIATSPQQGRAAIAAGKRVLVLSIEGAAGILETEADLNEFIDQQGVRIVTLLHFADDEFGGPSLLPGIRAWVTPLGWRRSLISPRAEGQVLANPSGLTQAGKDLAQKLIQRGVWIDLSHSSDASVRDLMPFLQKAKQPLLFTHTMLRSYYGAERGISESEISLVRTSHGIVGLIPSDDTLAGTHIQAAHCPCAKCSGGVPALAQQFDDLASILGYETVGLGTDIDAPLTFLGPGCEPPSGKMAQGYSSYAELPQIWEQLALLLKKSGPFGLTPETFFSVWEKVTKQ